MRYHWGLAVGHTYSHGQRVNIPTDPTTTQASVTTANVDSGDEADREVHDPIDDSDSEDPELGFDNEDDWIDEPGEDSDDGLVEDEEDDDVIVAMDDMYGFLDAES